MDIKEIANKLLKDNCNAILIAERMKRPCPKHGNIYYIDTSGIIRVSKNKDRWILVDGHNMPSKVSGKTIQELWNLLNI